MQTVEAAFRLLDQVSAPLRSIKKAGGETTAALKQTSGAVDDVNKHVGAVKETQKAVKGLGTAAQETAAKVDNGMGRTTRAFESTSVKGSAAIDKIKRKLRELELEAKRPKSVNINTAGAEAQIRILKRELNSLETKQARSELEKLGFTFDSLEQKLGGGGMRGGGGGPPPGRGGGGLIGGFFSAAGRIGFMAAAALAAAPAIVALSGAITALVGSLGAATLGAGAIGAAGIGALAVGLGSVVAVAKPAMNAIKETKKTQDAYNKSVQQYGRDSSQAAKAHAAYMRQLAKSPPGTRQLLQNSQRFGQQWRRATRPAQGNLIGIGNDTIQAGARGLPGFAAISNESTGALRTAVHGLTAELTSPEFMRIWTTLGHTFSQSIGPFSAGIGNIALAIGRIAQHTSPDVVRLFQSMETTTRGWAASTANVAKTGSTLDKLTSQTHSWWMLLKAVGRLLTSLFSSGANQGQGMVDRMTAQLDKWSSWINDNPAKMQLFFERTIASAGKLADAIGHIVAEVAHLADSLLPVLNILSSVSGFGASNGLLGPAGAYLALRRLRGSRGGGGLLGGGGAAGGGLSGAGAAGAGALGARGFGRAGGFAGMRETYGTQRALGASMRGAAVTAGGRGLGITEAATAGGVLRGGVGLGLRAAGKVALPLTAAMAAYDFLSTPGTAGQRAQATASGLTFGLIHRPVLGAEARAQGQQHASQYLASHPTSAAQNRIRDIQAQLAATRTVHTAVGGGAKGGNVQQAVSVQPVVTGAGRTKLEAELKALKPQVAVRVRMEQTVHGGKLADDIMGAFNTRLTKGARFAEKHFKTDLTNAFHQTGTVGKRVIAQNTVDWANQLSHGTKRQRQIAQQLRRDVVAQYRQMGQQIKVVGGNIVTGTDKDWGRIQGLMSSATEKALEDVTKGFTQIQQQAVAALELMGYSKGDARRLVTAQEKHGVNSTSATTARGRTGRRSDVSGPVGGVGKGTGPGAAVGGRVGGHGLIDNQNMGGWRGAPGELVINAAQERMADMKLGGMGALERITHATKTMHGVTRQQQKVAAMARHAVGGARGLTTHGGAGAGGGGLSGGIASLISQLDGKGFHHGSTTGGQHAAGSYHYRGQAVDYGDANNDMQALWNVVYPQRRRFAELFGPARLHPKPTLMHHGVGFSDAGLQAQHNNHIHMALAGALSGKLKGGMPMGGGAAEQIHLKGARTGAKGVPGALAQRALDAQRKGMEQHVNKQLAAMGGGGGPTGGGGKVPPGQVRKWLSQALHMTGHFSPANLSALYSRAMQESGGNPNAVNNWDSNAKAGHPSQGLLQTIPSTFARWRDPNVPGGIRNPIANAVAAINYMYGTYGHIVGASGTGYATGGRLPGGMGGMDRLATMMGSHNFDWAGGFKDGGAFTAHRPTLMAVGEGNRPEHVSVGPGGGFSGGSSAVHVSVRIGKIENHQDGDISEHIDREMKKVAKKLRGVSLDGDDEMND